VEETLALESMLQGSVEIAMNPIPYLYARVHRHLVIHGVYLLTLSHATAKLNVAREFQKK